MTWRFNEWSLRSKLTATAMLTTAVGVLICYGVFAVIQIRDTLHNLNGELASVAKVIGRNSGAALVFGDSEAATEMLQALREKPEVLSAQITLPGGDMFAGYLRPSALGPRSAGPLASLLSGMRTSLSEPVVVDGNVVGTVRIDADLGRAWTDLVSTLALTGILAIAVTGFVAFPLSRRLQRVISEPLVGLSRTASAITTGGDYSIRARKHGEDEVGVLIDAFNTMLVRIQERDGMLARYSQDLERRIEERTRELMDADARLHLALEASEIAFFDVDGRSGDAYLSKEWGLLIGGREPATTLPMTQILRSVHPNDVSILQSGIRSLLKGDRTELSVNFRIRREDGRWIWLHARGRPTDRDASGFVSRVMGTLANVTPSKEVESALRHAKETAESASRAKSHFLANMSHEIRTPMNGVLGVTELLLDTELSPRQQELAKTVQRSAEHLLGIINDILDFSKIEAGRMTLESTPFDLVECVEDVVQMFGEQAQDKGLEIVSEIADDIAPRVVGDPLRVRQIVANLVSNAVKFTESGEIVVRVLQRHLHPEHVVLEFEVSDTGIGIAHDALDRVFDAFAQADETTTRRFGGTGLGLSIVRQLVELMGGRIDVESTVGKGTVFRFSLRFQLDAVARTSSDAATKSVNGIRGRCALVVDDNATNRNILEHQCAALGLAVLIARDGHQAIEIFRKARGAIDVAILDMNMPVMSGLDVARQIRALESGTSPCGIIVLSSLSRSSRSIQGRELGISAWLRKPVRKSELDRCIAQALGAPYPTDLASDPGARAPGCRVGGHVLLVEDNPVNQLVAREMLRALGCTVDVANNGEECLDKLHANKYDVVLMDCQMPVLDGYETTVRWREHELAAGLARQTIVAVTANAVEGDRERCLAYGMDDYLAKPFRRDDLERMLARYLREGAPAEVDITAGSPRVAGKPVEIDPALIDRLRMLDGAKDHKMLKAVISAYLEASDRLLHEMRMALASSDARALTESAQSLKVVATDVGAVTVSRLAGNLECSSRNGLLEGAPVAIEELARSAELVATRLSPMLRETCYVDSEHQ